LDLSDAKLAPSWKLLRERGNLSSASALVLLAEVLEDPPAAGSFGLMTALGPGFSAELVLLQW